MAAFNKTQQFVEDLAKGVHVLGTHQLKVVCTNSAIAATDATYAALTGPLATTNLAGATPFNITTTSAEQTSGTLNLVLADLTLTASGGSFGPFRYVGIYNDTPTSPADPMIGWYDYGSTITLADTETLLIDFAANAITLT